MRCPDASARPAARTMVSSPWSCPRDTRPARAFQLGCAGVDRNTLLWTLVVFFGASLVFGALRRLTEDEPVAIVLAVQVGALALIVGAIVLVVRKLR